MTIYTTDLLNAVEQAKKYTPAKSSIPILHNIWIESTRDSLRIVTTNIADIYQNKIDQRNGEDFTTSVDASSLYKVIKSIKDSILTLEYDTESEILKLITKKTTYKLNTMKKEGKGNEYPEYFTTDFISTYYTQVHPEVSTELLKKVAVAAKKYEANNLLSTIHFTAKTNKLAATDGYRLFVCKLDAEPTQDSISASEYPELMFSAETANKLTESKYELGCTKTSNNQKFITFKSGDEVIYTRFYEGQYPKYEQLIPQHNDNIVKLTSKALVEALNTVALTCNNRTKITKLNFSDNIFTMSTSSPDLGETITTVDTDEIEGSDKLTSIAFNHTYLKDLTKIGTDLIFNLGSSLRVDIGNMTCLIMPIQIRDAA
jgi:DNA polymerase-3 subunit beta